jgi:ribonuclease HI
VSDVQLSFDAGDDAGPDVVEIWCDGGSRGNPGPAAIGAVVLDASTDPPARLATVSERIGVATNNVAEYRALIAALEAAEPFRARAVRVRADSQLVVRQVEGRYRLRQAHLRPLLDRVRELLGGYESVDVAHVSRAENAAADALVNAALDLPDDPGPA